MRYFTPAGDYSVLLVALRTNTSTSLKRGCTCCVTSKIIIFLRKLLVFAVVIIILILVFEQLSPNISGFVILLPMSTRLRSGKSLLYIIVNYCLFAGCCM